MNGGLERFQQVVRERDEENVENVSIKMFVEIRRDFNFECDNSGEIGTF